MIFGHHMVISQLLNLYNSHNLSGPILLAGPKGLGKASIAKALAKIILNSLSQSDEQPDINKHLNQVKSNPISTQVDSGVYPDYLYIKAKEQKSGILVEQARQIITFLQYKALDNGYRVIIIDSIDEMNTNGANCLLKSLEQLPQNVICFIINHNSAKVLPTIRSRSKQFNFNNLTQSEITAFMDSHYPQIAKDDREWICDLSQGNPGLIHNIVTHKVHDIYENLCKLLLEKTSLTQSIAGKEYKINSYVDLVDACAENVEYFESLKFIIKTHLQRNIDYFMNKIKVSSNESELFDLRLSHEPITQIAQKFLEIESIFNTNLDRKQLGCMALSTILPNPT